MTALRLLATHFVVLPMFLHGLELEPGSLRTELKRGVFWRGVAAIVLGVPLVTIAAVKLVPVPRFVAAALVLMAIAPGQEMLIRTAEKHRGTARLAVALALVLSLASVVTVPAWTGVLGSLFPVDLHASSWDVFAHLAPDVLLPFVLGAALRLVSPRLAHALVRPSAVMFELVLVVLAVALVALAGGDVLHARAVSLLVGAAVFAAWALVGWTAGGPDDASRRTFAIAAVFGNPAIALHVAAESFPGLQLVPTILAAVLFRRIVLHGAFVLSRTRAHRQPA